MTFPGAVTIARRCAPGLMLIGLLIGLRPAAAAEATSESAQLAILVRQLNTLDRLATASSRLPHDSDARYHFDYARLHADIARVRGGIQDYLSPPRAQPRDPVALLGTYRAPQDDAGAHP